MPADDGWDLPRRLREGTRSSVQKIKCKKKHDKFMQQCPNCEANSRTFFFDRCHSVAQLLLLLLLLLLLNFSLLSFGCEIFAYPGM